MLETINMSGQRGRFKFLKESISLMLASFCIISTLSLLGVFYFVSINAFAAVDEDPITMYASTPDGFSNGDPNTIKTIFATVHKADLGKFGFQWQATGQIKNTSDKPLGFLNVNIQLIDKNSKIVGLIPTITNVMVSSLEPGQTTTFNGLLNGNDADADAIAYKLTFEWKG